VKFGMNQGGLSPKTKYFWWSIVN